MEELKDFELNILSWYPFEPDKEYIIIKDFDKNKIKELEEAAKDLDDDAKIILLVNNRLGIKNICQIIENQDILFYRRKIEKILDENGLTFRKFYYPLPDIKTTNVIFTDKHLPDLETISRDIIFYDPKNVIINNEIKEYKKIIKENPELFKIFANSFFIECSKTEFEDNNIEFVSFANMRKEEYRIKTIIKGDFVYKCEATEKAKKHIENIKKNIDILNNIGFNTLDSYDDNQIISNYQKTNETLDKTLIKSIKENNIDFAKELMERLYDELKEKLEINTFKANENEKTEKNVFDKFKIEYSKEDISNLNFVKYGFWDLIFQNIFYINNKFYAYDQEWLEENLPLEYIVYRTFLYNQELTKFMNLGEIYTKFGINEKNIELFKLLDDKIQSKIRSKTSWKLNNSKKKSLDKIRELEADKIKITEDCTKLLNEKDARIKFLEDNMEETVKQLQQKDLELSTIKNSKYWKITKPLRRLRGNKNLL